MHVTQEESKTHSRKTGHGLLEELLTYDDLFLESFNAFLSLPVFPLRLQYDRLTGRLQELDGVFLWEFPSRMEVGPRSPLYGATDEERERTLSWLAQERFLPFQRTILYLEYKLAKLLICPLDENYPVSRYVIRGYSRQSDSTAVSSIPSYISTRRQATGVQSHMLLRLPSQTRSTPAYLGRFTSLSGELPIHPSYSSVLSLKQSPVVEHLSRFQLQLLSDSSVESTREMLSTGGTSAGEPVLSPLHLSRGTAPPSSPDQNYIELHISGNCEKPLSGPRKILQFDLDDTCNSKEDHQDLNLSQGPSFGMAALQQLKEDILGTRAGMESFKEFLHGTLGIHLLDFWIDCEDVMEQIRHLEATGAQKETQMFFLSALRSIQARYMLTVPLASQEQHGETTDTEETAFAPLSRKQYDALRRLRSYWVPRFLIHLQRTSHFQSRLGPNPGLQKEEERFLNPDLLFSCNMAGLFSIKDEASDTLSHMKRNHGWRMTQQFRENGRSGIGPNEPLDLPEDPFEKLTTTRFLQALMYDLGDGDGFLHYLTR
nr:PREDICTED: uncharacterized protein LOC103282419 [Anolis carolinensis]|eukprot:XP_016846092.1 PREDICTED: uncharacterized protein LOC103282419 [Anolis carolinensis]